MHDLTNNPFLNNYFPRWGEYSINSYLFGEYVAEKSVDARTFVNACRNLLSLLGFNVQLLGHKFLTRLLCCYLTDSDYSVDSAIKHVAKMYGTQEDIICGNVLASLDMNKKLGMLASKLLHIKVTAKDYANIDGALKILGAVFKTYYNYTVSDLDLDNDENIPSINLYEVFFGGE